MRLEAFLIIAILSLLFNASCKSRNRGSRVKIDHGLFALDSGSVIPGVLQVSDSNSRCTSVVVSDSTILTAAHCIPVGKNALLGNSPICIELISGKKVCTKEFYLPDEYAKYDIAIVVFPKETFKFFHRVNLDIDFEATTEVIIAGFSEEEVYTQEIYKRWGRNSLFTKDETADKDHIYYTMSKKTNASKAMINFGDSGGPLFNERCEVIGIASQKSWNINQTDETYGHHTKLASTEVSNFLKKIMTENGVKICINGQEGCNSSYEVKAVQSTSLEEFPCRADLEKSDPDIALELKRLADARAIGSSESNAIACEDHFSVTRNSNGKRVCETYRFAETLDRSKDCRSHFISPEGALISNTPIGITELEKFQGAMNVAISKDFAFEAIYQAVYESPDLERFSCDSGSKTTCCIDVKCFKIPKFDAEDKTIKQLASCPKVSRKNDPNIKNYYRNFLLNHIGPTADLLERKPFACENPLSMSFRNNTGICYIVVDGYKGNSEGTSYVFNLAPHSQEPSSTPRVTCFEVKNARKTERVLPCPRELESQLWPSFGS